VFVVRRSSLAALAAIFCAAVKADFTYQEIARSGKRIVHTSTKFVKGNRMLVRTKDHGTVINLENQTITEIDFAKKTYTVVPFPERKEDAPASALQVSVKPTGQSKKLGVLATRETIVTIKAEDSSTITLDAWIATVPGYDEIRTFYGKLSEKGVVLDAQVPEWARAGLAEADRQLNKLDGAPIQKTINITGSRGEFQTTIDLDDLGFAPLDAAKFEAPPGFKKVDAGSTPPQTPLPAPAAPN
jgi:hypothetical protein